jgi:hypothetical protein
MSKYFKSTSFCKTVAVITMWILRSEGNTKSKIMVLQKHVNKITQFFVEH